MNGKYIWYLLRAKERRAIVVSKTRWALIAELIWSGSQTWMKVSVSGNMRQSDPSTFSPPRMPTSQ